MPAKSKSAIVSISEAADMIPTVPRKISDLLYLRQLDLKRCPRVGRTHVIERSYVPEIRKIIRRREESAAGV